MSIESHFRAKPEFDLPLNQTALVIVDMQRGGLLADVGMGPDNAKRNPEGFQSYQKYVNETLIPNNERLLERARALGMRVIFLTSGAFWADQADLNGPRRRKDLQRQRQTGVKTLFSIGEYEHGIIDQLAPVGDEPVLNKVGASGFAGTGMDQMLRWLGISTVIFTGIGTPACVESTVRQGADLG
ncbi:MAG: cysteine hydrolase [Thermaerobacterales bacterium]